MPGLASSDDESSHADLANEAGLPVQSRAERQGASKRKVEEWDDNSGPARLPKQPGRDGDSGSAWLSVQLLTRDESASADLMLGLDAGNCHHCTAAACRAA